MLTTAAPCANGGLLIADRPVLGGPVAMVAVFFILFIGLEVKHYLADYFLQPGWMLGGKGDFRHPGGYAHAAIHVALSVIVLFAAGTPAAILASLIFAEYIVHYVLDYSKVRYSRGVHISTSPRRFWALHGLDQLAHQLTYAAMIFLVLQSKNLL